MCAAIILVGCSNNEESARKLYNQAINLTKDGHQKEAHELYKKIVDKYPTTQTAVEVNKMLLTEKIITNKALKELFKEALDSYRLDNGSYPTTEEGLNALFDDTRESTWHGPYIPDEKYKNDANKFIYTGSGQEYSLELK